MDETVPRQQRPRIAAASSTAPAPELARTLFGAPPRCPICRSSGALTYRATDLTAAVVGSPSGA
eukprot:4509601-Pyramimonas_sp.AAC.1